MRRERPGTSQKLDSEDEDARVASFVGVLIDDPRIAVLIVLDEPHSYTTSGGARAAAPVVAGIIENTLEYYDTPRALHRSRAGADAGCGAGSDRKNTELAVQQLQESGFAAKTRGSGDDVVTQYPAGGQTLPRAAQCCFIPRRGWNCLPLRSPLWMARA